MEPKPLAPIGNLTKIGHDMKMTMPSWSSQVRYVAKLNCPFNSLSAYFVWFI